jgi:hypothetical protein
MRFNITNPTKARRVIYDGIAGQQNKIQIAPGETKYNVELADHISSKFEYTPTASTRDLVLTPLDSEPRWPEPPQRVIYPGELPEGYQRYQAPPIEAAPEKVKAKRRRPKQDANDSA